MDLSLVTQQLTELAREVKDFIHHHRNRVQSEDIELKSFNSLVSYVDKTAEEQLVKGLKTIVPEAGFITEEGTETQGGERYNWIVDPLDGTTNFLHGIPVFAISVALMDNDEVVAGLVWEIGQDESFTAWKGGGAWLNGKPIRVSSNTELKKSLIATGFPYYDFSRMQSFLQLLGSLFEKTRGVRRLGSAATDLAYVACGRFDGFFEYGLSPWDVAAGVLLVQEAGGKVSDYSGGNNYIHGQEIVAGSQSVFKPLQEEIQEFMN